MLCAIIVVACLARLMLWLSFERIPPKILDEQDHNTLAINLVQHGEFSLDPGTPTSQRPPLYPFVLAAIYKGFGIENFQAVRLLQAVLSLATVILVYKLGERISGPRVGLWTAGLTAFYPSLLVFNNLILTEVLYTFLVIGFCLTVIRAVQTGSFAMVIQSGVWLGGAALCRSAFESFTLVLGLYLLWAWRGPIHGRLLAAALPALAAALTISPWAVRNTQLEKTYETIEARSGRHLMLGNYEYTPFYRMWDAISEQGDRTWYSVLEKAEPGSSHLTQGQKDKLAMRYAVTYIRNHPWLTIRRDIIKFFNFWGLERDLVAQTTRGFFGRPSILGVLGLTFLIFGAYTLAMVTGITGAAIAPPEDRRFHIFLLLLIAHLCALHTVVLGHPRYHLPIMPLVLLYSACAIVHRREIWRRRGSSRFLGACGLWGVFVMVWLYEIAFVDGARFLEALNSMV
jgi:4-amino-4-deoxy-L-arabinose transferase-like glycosyltransferase